jgi:anaerobic selenocysteine-containing dehydrogenase
MKISRRDLLKFAAGSAAGILLTPVPWKVLDDSAIWTQNWPWIPRPAKGEITTRFATCSLCPAGCGLKVRCVGPHPVSLAGVEGHPVSAGVICPMAFAAHHLPYHPDRVTVPLRRTRNSGATGFTTLTVEEATATILNTIKSASAGEAIALLDQRPERHLSHAYRRLLTHIPRAIYIRGPRVEDATLSMSASILGVDETGLGFDLENARTIVNFGAPLFDGWGTPGRMMQLAETRRKTGQPAIFHIETRQSRSALQADSWISPKPATEGALALGLAHQLVQEETNGAPSHPSIDREFVRVLSHFPPEKVSSITGVSVERIRSLAHIMASDTPTLVLGAGNPAGGPLRAEESFAIASLNLLLGSIGRNGGIIARRKPLVPKDTSPASFTDTQIQDVPDKSIRVLLLDAAESGHAIPWSLIERKLADQNALVVSFSPYRAGLSRHAEIILPSPTFLESWQDVPAPFDSSVNTFALSAPLLTPPRGTVEPLDVLGRLAAAFGGALDAERSSPADLLKEYVQTVHASGRGSVFTPDDRRNTPVREMTSPDTLWAALVGGGCWVDTADTHPLPSPITSLWSAGLTPERLMGLAEGQAEAATAQAGGSSLTLMPYGWRGAAGSGQLSPVMSKLYQESGLRSISSHAFVNPDTGKERSMHDNAMATVQTRACSFQALVHFDLSVMPGVLHLAIGPDVSALNAGTAGDASALLSMCLSEDGRCWRATQATVKELAA